MIRPILDQYRPDLIVGACGQDASGFDPNGRQNLLMAGFRRLGRVVAEAADELCDGRLVLVQEGGYARTYAAYCLHATLEGVLGTGPLLADPIGYLPDDAASRRGRHRRATHLPVAVLAPALIRAARQAGPCSSTSPSASTQKTPCTWVITISTPSHARQRTTTPGARV